MTDELISKELLLKEIDEVIAQCNWEHVIKQLEELGKEHPNTYSQCNVAWQDCIDRAIEVAKKGTK